MTILNLFISSDTVVHNRGNSPNLVHHHMHRIVHFIASPGLLTTVLFLEEPTLNDSGEGGKEEEGAQATVGRHGFLLCFAEIEHVGFAMME